jgi:hypothetical protein
MEGRRRSRINANIRRSNNNTTRPAQGRSCVCSRSRLNCGRGGVVGIFAGGVRRGIDEPKQLLQPDLSAQQETDSFGTMQGRGRRIVRIKTSLGTRRVDGRCACPRGLRITLKPRGLLEALRQNPWTAVHEEIRGNENAEGPRTRRLAQTGPACHRHRYERGGEGRRKVESFFTRVRACLRVDSVFARFPRRQLGLDVRVARTQKPSQRFSVAQIVAKVEHGLAAAAHHVEVDLCRGARVMRAEQGRWRATQVCKSVMAGMV